MFLTFASSNCSSLFFLVTQYSTSKDVLFLMHILTRIYFGLYLLLFFGMAQEDTLQVLECQTLGRQMPHTPWLVAIVLTAICLCLVRMLHRAFSKLCHAQTAIPAYFATAWLATMLVCVPFASCFHFATLTIAAIALCAACLYLHHRWGLSEKNVGAWHKAMLHIVVLLLLSTYIGIGAAATDTDHYEMKTSRLLLEGKFKKVKHIGENSLETTPRLIAMRTYAMATAPGRLGERFFDQPLTPSTNATTLLLPQDDRQAILFPVDSLCRKLRAPRPSAEEQSKAEKAVDYFRFAAENAGSHPSIAADYYLCALLANRQIDLFAREIQHYYPQQVRKQKHLPKYYAQALVMYTHMRTRPTVVFSDAAVEANYNDYSEMRDTLRRADIRNNMLRRSYGETYWWYYQEGLHAQSPSH